MDYDALPIVDRFGNPEKEDQDDYSSLPITSLKGEGGGEDYESLPITSLEDYRAANPEKPAVEAPTTYETKASIVANPEKMEDIRNYMIGRRGVKVGHLSDEDLVETFVNHMRYNNSNEVSTFGEWRYIQHASDDDKARAAAAYKVYDELGSMWQTGDILDATKDYTWSMVTAPSTWIGGVVGGRLAGKLATESLIQATKQAIKTGGKEAGRQVLKSAAIANVAKRVGIAGTVDGSIATLADMFLQENDIELGRQDEYSYGRGALAAATGVVGAGVAAIPELTALRNVSGLNAYPAGHKRFKIKKTKGAQQDVALKLHNTVNKLVTKITSWEDYAKAGKALNPTRDEVVAIVDDFLNVDNPDSVTRIILDSGADIDLSDDVRFTEQILDFAQQLPQKNLDEYNEILKPTGYRFGDLINIVADAQKFGGHNLNKAGRAKLYAKSLGELTREQKAASAAILADDSVQVKPGPRVVEYATSLWRRAIVSHPTTSMINVLGWGQAISGKGAAELAQAGLLGVMGMGGKITGKGSASLAAANALYKHQTFKLRTLVDPYSTREAWEAIVNAMPKNMKKQVNSQLFGGVAETGPGLYNIKPNAATNAFEKYVEAAGQVSLMKFQDDITKTFSGVWAIDKELRLRYGKGFDQVIAEGKYELISEDMARKSLEALLEDTFSANVTKASPNDDVAQRLFKGVGRAVESFSDLPGVGFMFPFGKFLTNNIAFLHEYGPTGLMHLPLRVFKDEPWALQEKLAKGSVGTLGLSYFIANAMEGKKEGDQWYEIEGGDGAEYDGRNLAPGSSYMLFGRLFGEAFSKDGYLTTEAVLQAAEALGTSTWMRNLDKTTDVGKMMDWISSIKTEEDASVAANALNAGVKFVTEGALPFTADIAAGFTRPFDIANDIVGLGSGSDVQIDRRINEGSEKIIPNLTRYTSNFFAPLLGEPVAEDGSMVVGRPARSASEGGDLRDPNPLSSLFGAKELPAKDNISALLGSIGLPPYLVDSRTADPEWDLFLNETIFPLLNERAGRLMNSELYKNSTPEMKFSRAEDMFKQAKKDAIEILENGHIDGSVLANARRKWSLLPKDSRNRAKEHFGITGRDSDLTLRQIDAMRQYMDYVNDFEKTYQGALAD